MEKLSKILALILAGVMVINIGVFATNTDDATEGSTTEVTTEVTTSEETTTPEEDTTTEAPSEETTDVVEEESTETPSEETTTETTTEETTQAPSEETTTEAAEEESTEAPSEETTTEVAEETTTEVAEESTTTPDEEATTTPDEETTAPDEETTTPDEETTTTPDEETTVPDEETTTIPDATEPTEPDATEPDVTDPTDPEVTEPTEPEKPAVDLPAVPANIKAGAFANGNVSVTWDAVEGATGYAVYLKSGKNWVYQSSVTKTKCTLKNALYNSKYVMGIKSFVTVDGVNYESAEMAEYTVLTGTDIPETKFTVSASSDTVTLKWDAIKGVSGYRVYIKQDGKWVKLTSTSENTYTYKKALPGKTYKFAIKPYAKGSEGTKFGKLQTGKVAIEDYSKTVAKATDKTTSTITIKWDKVKNASNYRVYIYKNGKWTYYKGITKNTYTIKGLKDATNYKIKVKASFKADGKVYWGSYSNTLTVTTTGKVVKAHRIADLKKLTDDNVFAFKLTGKLEEDGQAFTETIARKGNKYYMNVDYSKDNGSDRIYIGDVKAGTVYILTPAEKDGNLYGEDYFDVTYYNFMEYVPFDAKNVKAKTTTFNGKRVVAEYYTNADSLKKTYYFDGDTLVGLNLKYGKHIDIDYTIKVIADPTDSYFKVPNGYTIYKSNNL